MPAWNLDLWNRKNKEDPSAEFLNPQGTIDSLYDSVPDDLRTADGKKIVLRKPCLSNGNCGSGFSCIGGWCTNPYNDRGASNPGDCGPDKPNTPCKETFRVECSQPGSGCYYDKLKEGCCGNTTCYRVGAGVVTCECDDDGTRQKPCNKFCTNYWQANGELGPGCSEDITCSECFTCTEVGTSVENRVPICQSKSSFQSPPCWCSAGGNCPSGQGCNRTTGECEDSNNKAYCYSSSNFSCTEGGQNYNVKVCRPTAIAAQAAYNSTLKNICDKENKDKKNNKLDRCKGKCETTTREGSAPACPPQSSCKQVGSISGGGKTYTVTEVCDKTDVPESCKECDCNCSDECGPCKVCGEGGRCEPDPGCEDCGSSEESGGGRNAKLRFYGAWSTFSSALTSGGSGTPFGLCKTYSVPGGYNSLRFVCGIGVTTHIQFALPSRSSVGLVTFNSMSGVKSGCITSKLPAGACAQGLPNGNSRFMLTIDGSDPSPCTYVVYNRTESALTSGSFNYRCFMYPSSVPTIIKSPAFCSVSELNEMFNIPPGKGYSVYAQYRGDYG